MRWFPRVPLACWAVAALLSCDGNDRKSPAPPADYARAPSLDYASSGAQVPAPRVNFVDITREAGIDFHHETGAVGRKWMPETMGSGCALFDYDGDDDLDILLVNSNWWRGEERGSPPTSKLYRNRGDGLFEDVTLQAALDFSVYGMGVTIADYDADGDPDIYMTTLGKNLLLRNDQGRFVDCAGEAGVAGSEWTDDSGRRHSEWSTAAAWVDVDGDGWLDLFSTNYVQWSPETDIFTTLDGREKSYATPQQYTGSTCRLYRNRGNGTFDEITREAGVYLPKAKSMGICVADLDGDDAPDLVITNDTQPNFLLRNLGDGRFEEIGLEAGIGFDETGRARAGMGVDISSLGNDGVQSIAIGNFSREALSLYRQTGEAFLDVAGKSRLVQPTLPTLTFGLRFFDYDLDGFQDLILANGHIEPEINSVQRDIKYMQKPQLFWNDGTGRMIDCSEQIGGPFSQPFVGRGLAVGDIDADGDIDVLFTTNGGPARLLRNDGPTGRSVALHLRGAGNNPDALGTLVTAIVGSERRRQMARTGSSYLSHSAPTLTFGLARQEVVDRLEVLWPDGEQEIMEGLEAGFQYWIEQSRGVVRMKAYSTDSSPN